MNGIWLWMMAAQAQDLDATGTEPVEEPTEEVAEPDPTPDEMWRDWLTNLDRVFGDPRPTDEEPLAEIVVITDQQVRFLGGERNSIQSLTSDFAVDVAIRPIAQDLFGFSVQHVLRTGLMQYRERNPDRAVLYADTGDLVDLACRKELALVFAGIEDMPLPDVIATGNHDFNYAGNFRMNSDMFGASYFSAGGDFKSSVWSPSCGGMSAAADATPKPENADDPRHAALGVILEKDAFSGWVSDVLGGATEPVLVESYSPRGYRVAGQDHDWDRASVVVEQFWSESESGTQVAWVELDKTCEGRPRPGCREPGRTHMILSAKRLHPDWEYWLIGLDTMDQIDVNPLVPGLYGSYSGLQTEILAAFIETRRDAASDDRPARFVFASHVPVEDILSHKNISQTGMIELFHASDLMFSVHGHTHTPEIRPATWGEMNMVAKGRKIPLVQYIAGSTLDWPAGGLRVALMEEEINDEPVLRPAASHFYLAEPPHPPRDAVEAELVRHQHSLSSYRNAGVAQRTWRWEKRTERGSMLTAFKRMLSAHQKIDEVDTTEVMRHQFHEMVEYLRSVERLLEADGEPTEDALASISGLLRAAEKQMREWEHHGDATHGKKHPAAVEQFLFECDAAADVIPENPFFSGSKNCVEGIQHALRQIPHDTLAFEFMVRMSLRAGLVEHCSSREIELTALPPECREVWYVGPYTPTQ